MWIRSFGGLLAAFIALLGMGFILLTEKWLSRYTIPDSFTRNLVLQSNGFHVIEVNDDYFDCSPIKTGGEVGSGWQKVVHSVSNETVAKFPRLFGPAHNECIRKENDFQLCRHNLLQYFVDEIKWLSRLRAVPGVMISYCIPKNAFSDLSGVRVIVERGEPLTSLDLIQYSWHRRKEIISDIVETVSSLRRYSLSDFRRQQFVMINGKAKLSDVDHILDLPMNESAIVGKISREFLPFILTKDAPPNFISCAKKLNSSLTSLRNFLVAEDTGFKYGILSTDL